MKINKEAKLLADKISDAYSADRFKNWSAVVQALLNKGYSELETEAILRSKWSRWACDHDANKGVRYGHHTSTAMINYLSNVSDFEIAELTFETFGVCA